MHDGKQEGTEAAFSYARYLAAKEYVDNRSINQHVWQRFLEELDSLDDKDTPVRILELGAGIGATLKRVVSSSSISDLDYTLVDIEEDNVRYFKDHLATWIESLGFQKEAGGSDCWINLDGRRVKIRVVLDDINEFGKPESRLQSWDILIAQAFLDLFDLRSFVPFLFNLLKANALFYFPINFDGITSFSPTIDRDTDDVIEAIYHTSMDARSAVPARKGRSQSGRYLLDVLMQNNAELLAAGSSDWLIHPISKTYHPDERFFLEQILWFFEQELRKSNAIDKSLASVWLHQRRKQLAEGGLVFLAHQIDVLGRTHD